MDIAIRMATRAKKLMARSSNGHLKIVARDRLVKASLGKTSLSRRSVAVRYEASTGCMIVTILIDWRCSHGSAR